MIWDNLPPKNQVDVLENDPDYQYLPWHVRWLWKRSVSYVYATSYPDKTRYAEHMMEISKKMLLALYRSECPLLIGTDANFVGVYPGYSVLREMELFSEVGIPTIDILKSATLTAAKALNKEHDIGTLTRGKIANMILLEANPLEDIKNIYRMSGVFIRGTWMSKEDIEKMLDAMY